MTDVVKQWEACQYVAVPLAEAAVVKGIRRGALVSCGQALARAAAPLKGDVHASVDGEIIAVNEREIIIARNGEAVGRTPRPVDLAGLPAMELALAYKELGLDIPEAYPGEPFIIAAFNTEPGLTWAPALFSEHKETMQAGLDALEALYPGHPLVWASPAQGLAPDNIEEAVVNPVYPHSHPLLIKRQILGRPVASPGGVFDGRDLFLLGRVWRTGLPVTQLPLTLGEANYFVPLGSRLIDLLSFANQMPEEGDLVIVGGFFRGHTTARLESGLGKKDAALHLIKNKHLFHPPSPCRGCGECERACPLKLPVSRAGRMAPEQWLEGQGAEFLGGCLKCGICALACPSRRPLMSMARLLRP